MPTIKSNKTAAKSKAKTIKPSKAVKPSVKATAPKAPAPFVHAHHEAGVSGSNYTGLSGYLNANRKPRVAIGGDHKYNRTPAQLTARTIGTLKAMRDAYAAKPFNQRGFDNAVTAMLTSAGLIAIKAGTGMQSTDNGITYATDGDTPLAFTLTKAGLSFGQAIKA